MEHHFVHRVSRLFPSSFTSCQFRNVPDVVESSIPITKTTIILHGNNGGPEPFSHMYKNPFLSKPQEPKTPKNENKLSKNFKKTLRLGSDTEGRRCPPVTPISVLASEKRVKPKESKINNSSSSNGGWFSSDDEEGDVDGQSADAFFSLSSCSSESFRLKTANTSRRFDNKSTELIGRCSYGISAKSTNTILSQCSFETTKTSTKNPPGKYRSLPRNQTQFVTESGKRGCEVVESSTELYYGNCRSTHRRETVKSSQKTGKNRRSRNATLSSRGESGSAVVNERLEESYAVEKSSNDPHGDFRTSMVEMIIEKQIFGAKDLERLLCCFLSLNSPYYHGIIVEVFTEICDTLFNN